MARGRPPTPTAVLKARGSWRAKTRPNEPVPTSSNLTPTPPETLLDPVAKEKWASLVQQLTDMDVLTEIDGDALARYCITHALWVKAAAFLKNKKTLTYPIRDKNGDVIGSKPYPEAKLMNDYASTLLRLEHEFGMTPSSRTQITTNSSQTVKTDTKKDRESRFFIDV